MEATKPVSERWQFTTRIEVDQDELPGFDRLLEEWLLVQQKYCAWLPTEHPWEYTERPSTGHLAVAAFNAGGIAVEEWKTRKVGEEKEGYGRNDLWIRLQKGTEELDYYVECKWGRVTVGKSAEDQDCWNTVKSLVDEARKSASKLTQPRKIGLVFFSLYIGNKSELEAAADADQVGRFVDNLSQECGPHTFAGIWLTPESFKNSMAQTRNSWKNRTIGMVVMASSVTILDTIVEQKKTEVARLPERAITGEVLQEAVRNRGGARGFLQALRQPRRGVALIAEVKKASPSMGVICHDFDPVRIARDYEAAGADCLSVLTDEKFFQGSLSYLKQIRAAVSLPLLRKDFIIDERQILEAIEWGADAILLIVAILSDAQLKRFHSLAAAAGLAALVEVHDEIELDRALAAGAELVGVNNRNLKTFKVDLGHTERLAARLRAFPSGSGRLLVAESGIHTRADVQRVQGATAQAILVGESLVKQGNIRGKVAELLG